jgi:hypothetical protein
MNTENEASMHNRVEKQLLLGLDELITSARAVSSGYISAKKSTLEKVFNGSIKLLIGTLTGLHHLIAGLDLNVSDDFMHSIEAMTGITHLGHIGLESSTHLSISQHIRSIYENHTKDYCIETQLKFVNSCFPPFGAGAKRASLLVKRLLESYSDPLSKLDSTSQLIFGGYLLSLILEYVRHGFVSESAKLNDITFTDELMSWLAYRAITNIITLPSIPLNKINGEVINADEILKNIGIFCLDEADEKVQYQYSDTNASDVGHRFAVNDEIKFINQKFNLNLRLIPFIIHETYEEKSLKKHKTKIKQLENTIEDQNKKMQLLEGLLLNMADVIAHHSDNNEDKNKLIERANQIHQKFNMSTIETTQNRPPIYPRQRKRLQHNLFEEKIVMPVLKLPENSIYDEISEKISDIIDEIKRLFQDSDEDSDNEPFLLTNASL